tara:strand:- start:600 stop:1190 length:591 start_codon:yes stop_codon:yes gene_type:complete
VGREEVKTAGQTDLGKRVRALRKTQALTLGQLGAKAGLAPSTLSKVENNQMSPTYDVLCKLSAGLGMSLVELLAAGEKKRAPALRYSITRAGQGRRQEIDGLLHEMLCSDVADKPFLPFVTRVMILSMEEHGALHRHGGVDFFYVLSGACTVITDSFPPAELETGDSIFFDAAIGHALIKRGAADVALLWVANSGG